jgi:single-strand DNA-binding protein
MNSCTFAGRVGTVRPLSRTNGGDAVFNFSVAVDRGKSKDGEKRNPLWVGVTLWKEQAENLSKYISKGDPIAVSGQVDLRTYEVQGETRTELILQFPRVTLLGNGNRTETRSDADESGADGDTEFPV